jgi:hypothetical protein
MHLHVALRDYFLKRYFKDVFVETCTVKLGDKFFVEPKECGTPLWALMLLIGWEECVEGSLGHA